MEPSTIVHSYNVSLGDMVKSLSDLMSSRPNAVRIISYPDGINYTVQWKFEDQTVSARFVLDSSSQLNFLKELIEQNSLGYLASSILPYKDRCQHFVLLLQPRQ